MLLSDSADWCVCGADTAPVSYCIFRSEIFSDSQHAGAGHPVVFLVGVAPFLTMEELYRRGVLAIIVLAAGIVFVLLRAIGVGDIKASTVFVLFLEDYELALFMIALALASVVGLMMLKVMRPFVLRKNYEAIAEWQCWHDRQHFPFGFALAGALFMVVGIRVLATFLGYPG